MRDVIVFDIDGTMANIDHRRHFVATKPKNWAAFEAIMHLDTPNHDIIKLARMFVKNGDTVLVASGRGEQKRDVTEAWLEQHGAPYTKLYMRKAKDNRPDYIVKEEILDQMIADGFNPVLVFDDRQQVVDMWRRRGIRCLQVAPGDF